MNRLVGLRPTFLRHCQSVVNIVSKFRLAMSVYNPWALTVYCLTFVCIWAWKVKQKTPLADLPGPPPESFLLGMNNAILPSSIINGELHPQEIFAS
jgi:hypothetical protein